MTMHRAIYSRGGIDCMCQEKKEEEDSLELKTASMYHDNNLTNKPIRAKKD